MNNKRINKIIFKSDIFNTEDMKSCAVLYNNAIKYGKFKPLYIQMKKTIKRQLRKNKKEELIVILNEEIKNNKKIFDVMDIITKLFLYQILLLPIVNWLNKIISFESIDMKTLWVKIIAYIISAVLNIFVILLLIYVVVKIEYEKSSDDNESFLRYYLSYLENYEPSLDNQKII